METPQEEEVQIMTHLDISLKYDEVRHFGIGYFMKTAGRSVDDGDM